MSRPREILESSKHMQLRCKYGKLHLRTGGYALLLQSPPSPLSHNAPGCSVYLSTPPKKLSKEDSSSVVAVLPKTSFTISISVSTSLSSACSTGSHNYLIHFCPTSFRYIHNLKYFSVSVAQEFRLMCSFKK